MRKPTILAAAAMALLVTTVSAAFQTVQAAPAGKPGGLFAGFAPYPPMITPIRIGLKPHATMARFAVWAPGFVFVDGQPVFPLQPMTVYTITGGRIVGPGGQSFQLPMDRRSHVTARDYRIWTNNHWYRGGLELISFGSSVSVLNLLDMEDYLLGVVPSEMPSSWHIEALKAQAVAARSYAWAHIGSGSKWRAEGYDLKPDVSDQAYNGLAAEANSTYNAVQSTRGMILKDSGRVKPGFYRAWVGDAMENLNIRTQRVPKAQLEKITGVSDIVGVTVKQFDPYGSAHNVQIMGTKKTRDVYGKALAQMLGLQTAGILDAHEEGDTWLFTYRGPGNGARGLSQHGANMLAKNGWRFDQILQQYYQDADGQLRLDYMNNYRSSTAQKSI
ncbi:MAG: SpoIID/LytB domain-containing protein [Candidatus Obscuribacterales bacterium]